MTCYIISITAQDRPGIVSGVSQAICRLDGNIEAASQTVHQGYFAMIIKAAFNPDVCADKLTDLIQQLAGNDLHVYLTPYIAPAVSEQSEQKQSFIVTALGPDKPGVLQSLTTYLASKNINIDDLYCCVEHDDFQVICQVSVPAHLDVFMLQTDLETLGKSLDFAIHMQHENIFVATNELHLAPPTSA